MATALLIGGMAAQGLGAISKARAQRQQAADSAAVLENQAAQDEIDADEQLAQGQAEGFELRRRKDLAISKLQARAAKGAFSATDSTILDLEADLEEEGTVQQGQALAGGLARQGRLQDRATGRRSTASATRKAGKRAARATLLSSAGSMATSFGTSGFFKPSSQDDSSSFSGRYGMGGFGG